jgi:hypothetical protein
LDRPTSDLVRTITPVLPATDVTALPAATAVVTNAVVANWVVLVPAVAVGAAGVPVKVGDANGALVPTSVLIALKLVSNSVNVKGEPLTCRDIMFAIYKLLQITQHTWLL